MTSNSYWRIALPCPLRQMFVYSAPRHISPQTGDWALVPFGNRKVVGVVLEVTEKPSVEYQIKDLISIQRNDLRLPGSLVDLILWSLRYYHAPPWETLATFLPVNILQGKPPEVEPLWGCQPDAETKVPNRAHRQRALLEWLQRNGPSDSRAISEAGFSRSLVRQLRAAEALRAIPRERSGPPPIKETPLLTPTTDQNRVIDLILQAGAKTFLLDGVTGSGKTLVYQHLARHQLNLGKQVLILVPEIGLVPQMLAHCRQLVDQPFCYHSGMTDSQRAETWVACLQGRAQLVIGTRSALFLPLNTPGLIVVDEEQDSSYKQLEGMRYQTRDIAVIRGSQMNIPIVLGSATPSLESLYNVKRGNYYHLRLPNRVAGGEMPLWRVVAGQGAPENSGLLPESLVTIQKHLEANQQVLVFINRRGYAPCLRCSQCGWQANCESCESRFTYHKSLNELRCHRCDLRQSVPSQCPLCASQRLSFLGQGTERIAHRLGEFFPDVPVIRIDRDATRGREGMQRKLDQVHASGAAILVGTQMLAKGHHFPKLSMALIMDIDYAMMSADFRATEQAMQLVTQVAGRTGRESAQGEVLLQTEFGSHPMLGDLISNRYGDFAGKLLQDRQRIQLPPFCYMVILRAESEDYRLALSMLQDSLRLAQSLDCCQCQIIGPSPSPTEKRAGRYRFQLQITSSTRSSLHELLSAIVADLDQRRHNKTLRWHLDIDPVNLD